MLKLNKFPSFIQHNIMDCGPSCLKIISKHYGRDISLNYLRKLTETNREGSSLFGLSKAAEKVGLHSVGAKVDVGTLAELPLPCIIHWRHKHFVVLYKVKKNKFYISDPESGLVKYKKEEFLSNWIGNNAKETDQGVILMVDTTKKFYDEDELQIEEETDRQTAFDFLKHYLWRYRSLLFQLLVGILLQGFFQVIFPLLTQSIVDVGIQDNNLNFIYLILLVQLMFMLGKIAVDAIKNWILLHLSTRINVSFVSDFFIKLMKLPISYFDTKLSGDLMQRIRDHDRVEVLLTSESLNIIFAVINLAVFSALLAYYNLQIFALFWIGSILFVGWIFLFIRKRKRLDHKIFELNGQEQSRVLELIGGMQEIKLHNIEEKMRWRWEYVKALLFKVKVKFLSLEQKQSVGGVSINEIKNILIIVLTAKLVIDGSITLGAMLAISYIVGQLNGPLRDLINFSHTMQNAKLSMERILDIHNKEEEESKDAQYNYVPDFDHIELKDMTYRYPGMIEPVLDNISLKLPVGKTTAIVGPSGSGKTTLMKMLLKFYEPNEGQIRVGKVDLTNITHHTWRDYCGVVMQEGFIFNNTIAFNVAVDEEYIDFERLTRACEIAQIRDFIEQKPLAYNTKIGEEGVGLSTGQKQRILIARAVYKNPEFILFDEATSALDANNEKSITENLNRFLQNKTAVIIAHRLSTVKNADNIVVLNEGQIVEQGTHDELIMKGGAYYRLVKNQLELDKQEVFAY